MRTGTVGHDVPVARDVFQRRHREPVSQPSLLHVNRVFDPVTVQIALRVANIDYRDRFLAPQLGLQLLGRNKRWRWSSVLYDGSAERRRRDTSVDGPR